MSESDLLEKQFTPQLWSKRLPPDLVIKTHLEFITKESEICKNAIPNQLNIPYGKSDRQKYDLLGADLPNDAPIFIFVHGGFWQRKAVQHSICDFIAKQFYKNDYKTVTIGYDLCPDVTLKQIIKEIQDALYCCIEYAVNIKSREIIIAGHSAGAHLIATCLPFINSLSEEKRNIVKAAFFMSGIFDLTPLLSTSLNNILKLDEKLATELSPLLQNIQAPKHLKYYLIIAENDSEAFKHQSKLFCDKLQVCGFNANFAIIENVDHYDLIEQLIEPEYKLTTLILNSKK